MVGFILGVIAFLAGLALLAIAMAYAAPLHLAAPFMVQNLLSGGWNLSTCLFVGGMAVAAFLCVYLSRDGDWVCPLPQLLFSLIVGIILAVCMLLDGYVQEFSDLFNWLLEPFVLALMVYPMIAIASGLLALPLRLMGMRSHAFLSMITVFLGTMAAEGIQSLLHWMDLPYFLSFLEEYSRFFGDVIYSPQLRMVLSAYQSIPVWGRILGGGVGALLTGLWLYALETGYMPRRRRRPHHRRTRHTATRTATRPATHTAARPAPRPAPRPAVQMNSQDQAALDALTNNVLRGIPIGIDTRTGSAATRR